MPVTDSTGKGSGLSSHFHLLNSVLPYFLIAPQTFPHKLTAHPLAFPQETGNSTSLCRHSERDPQLAETVLADLGPVTTPPTHPWNDGVECVLSLLGDELIEGDI